MIKIEELWQKRQFNPTVKQKEAILHIDGPLYITAGPGSGKTRVLLWRTLNLIVYHDVKPEEIFLSTFTEKAAKQLKDGLQGLLGIVTNETGTNYDISNMYIGTVHSLCQKVLQDRKFSPNQVRKHAPKLLEELNQYFFIHNLRFWNEMLLAGGFEDTEVANQEINDYFDSSPSKYERLSKHEAVTNIISIFNRFSEEVLDPDHDYNLDANDDNDQVLLKIIKMYKFYLAKMIEEKSVDFSLLQKAAYLEIITNATSQDVFKYLIIDEYQDTNTIQEKIFFELASKSKNICVVGDDDQALYRFRGATVENFVAFPERCQKKWQIAPTRIDLDFNFRSPQEIVETYLEFINHDLIDWKRSDSEGYYRIHDKTIKPATESNEIAVLTTEKEKPTIVTKKIAEFIKSLKDKGKIEDYNQVAFLFPTLTSKKVTQFKDAFEELSIPVYAPRAGKFLNQPEPTALFGLFIKIFGKGNSRHREYFDWLTKCENTADNLISEDKALGQFIKDKLEELELIENDFHILLQLAQRQNWELSQPFKINDLRVLANERRLSNKALKVINSQGLNKAIIRRIEAGNPYTYKYIFNRLTSVDWSLLDLFYQLQAFEFFKSLYDKAERGIDEGPVYNLSMITQFLSTYTDKYSPIITAEFLNEGTFVKTLFGSFLYAIFRLGESEYEDTENPFPKGNVQFLTIHQSKGLEFPVVILGSLYKGHKENFIESIIQRLVPHEDAEPLDRMGTFDNMRMFYVALSRPQHMLILPYYKGPAAACEPFTTMLKDMNFRKLENFDVAQLPIMKTETQDLGKIYSFTGDYLMYKKCPRNYMIFRKYGFVPSRTQSMFFGSLVHQTIEDLHNHLIVQKKLKLS